jgi:hypothetical protein
VPGFIDGKFRAVWEADGGQKSPALVGDILRDFGAFFLQLREGRADVVAHEVELVTVVVSGMNGKLGRRQGEDKPSSARVCRLHAEDVGEECADLLGLRGEHDRMQSGDHAAILAAAGGRALTGRICVRIA